jgi:hypothetical protein
VCGWYSRIAQPPEADIQIEGKNKELEYMRTMITSLTLAVLVSAAAARPLRGDSNNEKAQTVINAARAALGGEAKLSSLTGLLATGRVTKAMGDQTIDGDIEISLLLPDKYKEVETTSLMGGAAEVTRTSAVDGSNAWSDTAATSPGGGQVIIRGAKGGDESKIRAAQEKAIRSDFARNVIIWLIQAPASSAVEFTYAGEGETDKGHVDVIDAKGADDFAIRLFFDKETHLPTLVTYHAAVPKMKMMQVAGPLDAKKLPKLPDDKPGDDSSAKPQLPEVQVALSDYKAEGGVLLPHKFTRSSGGEAVDEIVISKYKLNPTLKPESFKKK